MGKSVGYARAQWLALNRYVDNGILSIDNNLVERVLRMVVIGRKNWLFAGSDNGGKRAAVIYSLVASCKSCSIGRRPGFGASDCRCGGHLFYSREFV